MGRQSGQNLDTGAVYSSWNLSTFEVFSLGLILTLKMPTVKTQGKKKKKLSLENSLKAYILALKLFLTRTKGLFFPATEFPNSSKPDLCKIRSRRHTGPYNLCSPELAWPILVNNPSCTICTMPNARLRGPALQDLCKGSCIALHQGYWDAKSHSPHAILHSKCQSL